MNNKEIRFNDAVIAVAQYLYDNDYQVNIKFYDDTNCVKLVVDGELAMPDEQMEDIDNILSDIFKHDFYWGSGKREVIIWNQDND